MERRLAASHPLASTSRYLRSTRLVTRTGPAAFPLPRQARPHACATHYDQEGQAGPSGPKTGSEGGRPHPRDLDRRRQGMPSTGTSRPPALPFNAAAPAGLKKLASESRAQRFDKRVRIGLLGRIVNHSPTKLLFRWNVNGLRAVLKKDFAGFLAAEAPDVLCLQETKISPAEPLRGLGFRRLPAQLLELRRKKAPQHPVLPAPRILSRERPLERSPGPRRTASRTGRGRVLTAEYPDFFPSSPSYYAERPEPRRETAGPRPSGLPDAGMGRRLPRLRARAGGGARSRSSSAAT